MSLINVIHREQHSKFRTESTHCEFPNCHHSTWFGKPLCDDHVLEMDYVKSISAELARRRDEIKLLSNRRPLPRDAHLIRETEILLLTNSCTVKRLARELSIPVTSAQRLIRRMVKLNLARHDYTKRGLLRIKPLNI